jgi:hypothetical protein
MIIGHLNFNEIAIIPIAGFLIAQSWRDWRWSFTDVLIPGGLIRAHELERRDGTVPVSVANQAAVLPRSRALRAARGSHGATD